MKPTPKKTQCSSIKCPVCKKTINTPGGSAAKLPVFFQASEIHNVRKGLKDRYKFCKKCKLGTHKVHVTSYCFVCRSGHCDNCCVKHDKIFQNHAHISVTPSTVNCIMCPDHDAHFTYFCMTCAKSICTDCYVGEHDKHKIYDLVYDGKEVQENVKEFLLSGLKSADKTMSNLDDLESKLSQDIKTAIAEMRSHRDYLLKLVNDQYEFMCLELSQKEADIKIDLVKSKQLVEEARSCIDRLLKQAESWQEPVKGIPEARIKNIEKFKADLKQDMPILDLDIKPQVLNFVKEDMNIAFGKIIQEESSVVDESSSLECEITGATQSLDAKLPCVKPKLLYHIETGVDVMDIDYLDNGQLVVCKMEGLQVYDVNGIEISHHISHIWKPCISGQLCSVSVDDNSKCVAVLEDRGQDRPGYLHIYMSNGDRWQYQKYVVCKGAWCVSVTCDGDYVVWSGRNQLYKCNCKGCNCWCIDTSSHGNWVYYVSVGDSDKIFVCFDHQVVVYNNDGHQLSTLTMTDRQLDPRGVCVDKGGNIVVCDVRNKAILLFNEKFHFVRCLINLDFEPCKMCMCNMRFAIYGDDDGKIYVYNLHM